MIRHLAIIATFAIATGTAANSEDLVAWGSSGDWAILIDPASGNGCLMEKKFDDGTLVQFGTVPNRNGGFFAAYNPDWIDIEDEAIGTVKLEFPKIRFVGDVVGVAKDGRFGGYVFFDNPNVVVEFSRNNDMTIIGELGRKIEVNLKGTSNAVKAVKTCQTEQSD